MPAEMSRHSRAMLLNVLWHHQGGSSEVGQPIRVLLGIGQHDHLTEEQVSEAKWIDRLLVVGTRTTRDVPERDALEAIGSVIGYGRAQQILGELWDAKHGCAPRGQMGVTVRDGDGVGEVPRG